MRVVIMGVRVMMVVVVLCVPVVVIMGMPVMHVVPVMSREGMGVSVVVGSGVVVGCIVVVGSIRMVVRAIVGCAILMHRTIVPSAVLARGCFGNRRKARSGRTMGLGLVVRLGLALRGCWSDLRCGCRGGRHHWLALGRRRRLDIPSYSCGIGDRRYRTGKFRLIRCRGTGRS